jgi:small subunit ribosomal protein S16
MLVIRLLRIGKKNQPSFKIIVTDKRRSATKGRFVEEVGFYNPQTKERVLKQDRIKYWLSVGAEPSPTVQNMLISEKVVEGKKAPIYMKKKPKEAEVKPAETKPVEAKPVAEKIVEEKPKEEAVKEEQPVEEKKKAEKSVKEELLVEEQPVEEPRLEKEKPTEEKKEEEKPVEVMPKQDVSEKETAS